jgi:large subunit ribosomal protein L17e
LDRSAAGCAQARGSHLRVHFKNTRETAFRLRRMELVKAKTYLEDVMARKRCVPFHRCVAGERARLCV